MLSHPQTKKPLSVSFPFQSKHKRRKKNETNKPRKIRLVVSAADPLDRNLNFLDRNRYVFFQIAPQLYSRGWADPVPEYNSSSSSSSLLGSTALLLGLGLYFCSLI
jgi:hypothetical protein